MKTTASVLFSTLALLLASCGGGGGGGSNSPPVSTPLAVTFVESGSGWDEVPSVTLPIARVITNQADLNTVLARMVPGSTRQPALTNPNFSLVSIVYLEGAVDQDPSSFLAITSGARAADGSLTFNVEYCVATASTGLPHRAYAFYTVPAQIGAATFPTVTRQLPNCTARTRLSPALVASGDTSINFLPGPPFRVVRNQAEWVELLQRVPNGSVPQAFLAPDFTRVTMIYMHGSGDNHPTSYIRLVNLLSGDGVQFGSAEYCWPGVVSITSHRPFAIYSVDVLGQDVRAEIVTGRPPNCATAR